MERRRRWLPLLVGGGVVAVAVYAAGAVDSGGLPATTTTTLGASLIDEALSGPGLEWRQLGTVGEGIPIAFGRSNGTYYVFANENEGLIGWRSTDLASWEPLAMTGIPDTAWSVLIDDEGLVATGSAADGRPGAWTSVDGESWTEHELPDLGIPGTTSAYGAVWHGGSLLVYGTTYYDPSAEAIAAALPSELIASVDAGELWTSLDGVSVTVYGPLGLPVYQVDLPEPGLDALSTQFTETSVLWISDDGEAWESIVLLEDGSVSTIAETQEGLVAFGWDNVAVVRLVSPDGRSWERAGSTPPLASDPVTTWGDRLIARPDAGSTSLYASTDGREWEAFQIPRGLFPQLAGRQEPWHVDGLAAGSLGLIATATSWRWEDVDYHWPPIVLEGNGHRLEQSQESGIIAVFDDSGAAVLILEPTDRPDPAVRYDPATEAVTFLDPADGSSLITVTADEWERAVAAQSHQEATAPVADAVLVFTTDGVSWSATAPDWLDVPAAYGVGPIFMEKARALALSISETEGDAAAVLSIWEGTLP